VVFSVLACILLQEMAGRIAISSGLSLGQSLRRVFGPVRGKYLSQITGWAVILGCTAYEAGNILGAAAGLQLLTGLPTSYLTDCVSVAAFVILWRGTSETLSYLMTTLVLLMAVGFFMMASRQMPSEEELHSALIPSMPENSAYILVALVGTTIVPYNLFLGSALSSGQTLTTLRLGLALSVGLGGFITGVILIAGTAVPGFTTFVDLAEALRAHAGQAGATALGVGLFAAGFSSAITAPYASAIIVRTVFCWEAEARVRMTWLGVLLIGTSVALSGLQPVPIILLVQAINGCILPLLVIVMLLAVNDHRVMAHHPLPGWLYNSVLLVVLNVVLIMGFTAISNSIGTRSDQTGSDTLLIVTSACCVSLTVGVALVYRRRRPIDI
jgi:Mn2+/Fe2+ NRAMP family transporter